MARRIRELSGAVAALAVLASCGVSEEEAVRYKDEAARQSIRNSELCSNVGCIADPQAYFCAELFFEFGRSPPLCVDPDTICEMLECQAEGRRCATFDGFPGQVKCID